MQEGRDKVGVGEFVGLEFRSWRGEICLTASIFKNAKGVGRPAEDGEEEVGKCKKKEDCSLCCENWED